MSRIHDINENDDSGGYVIQPANISQPALFSYINCCFGFLHVSCNLATICDFDSHQYYHPFDRFYRSSDSSHIYLGFGQV